jgi:hypothetical protein
MTPQSPSRGNVGRPPAAPVCPTRGIPAFDPATPRPLTPNRVFCNPPIFGVTNPATVLRNAAARAIQMLENTVAELVRARTAICSGAPLGWPTLSDVTAGWLKVCLSVPADDIRAWTGGAFQNMSVAEIIRRLVRVRNLIASNELQYVCGEGQHACTTCEAGDWAFVCTPRNCEGKTPQEIIHLCKCFWVPSAKYKGKPGETFDSKSQTEFQALVIIHEVSHLTHCTEDDPARTIGGAECLRQFVAATNNAPVHPCLQRFCPCPGGPGMPSAEELARINSFCDQHLECNAPAVTGPVSQPRASRNQNFVGEMDQPGLNMAEAEQFLKAGSEIRAQLNRNFLATDERGYLERRQKLRLAFRSVPDSFAESLFAQLVDKNDPLSKLFHYKLHPATINEMLGILLEKMDHNAQTI